MRHRKSFNHLGRKTAHRKAMLANMASSLILHKRISTTLAKAKALRSYIDPLITRSKEDSTHSRRMVFSYLQNKEAVSELFREVAQKVANRPGGYTRILKTGLRLGDAAEMCFMELVDYNTTYTSESTPAKAKSGRNRRGTGKKKADETDKPTTTKAPVKAAKVDEPIAPVVEEVKAHEIAEEITEEKQEITPEATEEPTEEETQE